MKRLIRILFVLLLIACNGIAYYVGRSARLWPFTLLALFDCYSIVVLITGSLAPWKLSLDFDSKLKLWDAFLRTVTAVILIVTAIVGVKQYLAQRNQLIDQNRRELNSMIYRTRLDLYQEATDTLSKFAYAPDTAEADKANRRFWELFDGKFSIVEDEEVQTEMRLCIDFLEEWEDCKDKTRGVRENLFANLAYDLSQSCRRSLKAAFPEAFNNPLTSGQAGHSPLVTRELLPCVCSSADKKWKPRCDEQMVPFDPKL